MCQETAVAEVPVQSWDECKIELQRLAEHRLQILKAEREKEIPTAVSPLLFRGQADADWKLETTLERYAGLMPLEEYYHLALQVAPEIESFTDRSWSIPPRPQFEDWIKDADFLLISKLFAHDYLAYIRHHGFPSPLLDWTRSPYVAAFFAFETARAPQVAIYSFMEYVGEGKTHTGTSPIISHLNSRVRTHRRNFLQQSEYTICTKDDGSIIELKSHEEVFAKRTGVQDLLWKITIPVSERVNVLRELDLMNINQYTLFGSEEGLMSTLALRQFHLKE